jgi:hypothetical protein
MEIPSESWPLFDQAWVAQVALYGVGIVTAKNDNITYRGQLLLRADSRCCEEVALARFCCAWSWGR